MLTKMEIRNFKRFNNVIVDLASPVVFIGPNNSGKTTALQALALWNLGVKKWHEKRGATEAPGKRPGVAINRRDFVAAPIPNANLLWRDLHVRDVQRNEGRQATSNVRIEILISGVSGERAWQCGFEFDYANEESFYCRPLRLAESPEATRMPVPPETQGLHVAFLPPMSGLSAQEFAKQPGEIAFLIGQGRTAEVLRNLCSQVVQLEGSGKARWDELANSIRRLFGIQLQLPDFIQERAEITLAYQIDNGCVLDLSCAGRGVQQTILLLAYMTVNPGAVMLLDEPDAHLEILRQREVYKLLSDLAVTQGSQLVIASHSEVILNEAADRDVVVAFVGAPHRIDDRGSQVLKSLRDIGFDQYYQAEQMGWVIYLEGSTDLAILQSFSQVLDHPAREYLAKPFVHYVANQPQKARDHFYGLREAKNDLRGILICDRLERELQENGILLEKMWSRREIENYLCQPATLVRYAESLADGDGAGPLFASTQRDLLVAAMQETIAEVVPPLALRDPAFQWWRTVKASDDFLDVLFPLFFSRIGLENLMQKTSYHQLARFVAVDELPAEVSAVLDTLVMVAHPFE